MSNILIELGVIHMALSLAYGLLLRREQDFSKMRFYLVASVLLALLIPLLKLPNPFYSVPQLVYTPETLNLPVIPIEAVSEVTPIDWGTTLIVSVYVAVSLVLLFKLWQGFRKILQLKRQSKTIKLQGQQIYVVGRDERSFSFFNWVFISENLLEDAETSSITLQHEKAHLRLKHSYDILLIELFKVCFWWLPSVWYVAKAIKQLHEYQADVYVLKSCDVARYSSVLISTTLNKYGWGLASPFHDGLILKRLQMMKKQTKSLNPWKVGTLGSLLTFLFVAFACSETPTLAKNEGGAQEQAKFKLQIGKQTVETQAKYPGGIDAFYSYLANEVRYPREARVAGLAGTVYTQFEIDKDGSITNVSVLKGIDDYLDQEAKRILKSSKPFDPATQQGKNVRVKKVLPVTFLLDPEKKNPDNTPQGKVVIGEMRNANFQFKIKASFRNGIWSGTIYDKASGDVLPGANVMVDGAFRSTVTDQEGNFMIMAALNENIVVSFSGYQSVQLDKC